MISDADPSVGLLLSGGLDSAILLGHLLAEGKRVQPFYIKSDLYWQREEQQAVAQYLEALASPRLAPLVTLDLPMVDLYGDHWSVTGNAVPGAETPDEAVYLPGRNALLLIKAALWCQMRDIRTLALAPLGSNPFADATPEFFELLETTLNVACGGSVRIICPFANLAKREVMQMGRDLPLELTFSCIAPRRGRHCGACNKCAERQAAFRSAGLVDSTRYVAQPAVDAEPASCR